MKHPSSKAAPTVDRLSDTAYRSVLEALFDRRVAAGSFVSQGDIARITGSPIGPLRDALKVLEADGVLKVHPRSGIQFVRPGLELTRSTYQFRAILERAAVRIFAEAGALAEIEGIMAAHRALLDEIETGSGIADLPSQATALEALFHDRVVGALDNRQIDAAYRRLATLLQIIRLDSAWSPQVVATTMREHLAVLERAQARDASGAEETMRQHLANALQRHLKVLQ